MDDTKAPEFPRDTAVGTAAEESIPPPSDAYLAAFAIDAPRYQVGAAFY